MSFGLDSPILSVAWRMADPFFEAVRDYPYHNRYHTERVFARAMELCDLEKITSDSREEIAIAIIFHDVGYARRYARNEPIGAEIARSLLVTQWWEEDRIERVESLILSTALGSETPTLAHAIIQDSDLDMLGLPEWIGSTFDLYQEIVLFSELPNPWIDWLEQSAELFRTHEFATKTARTQRTDGQRANLAKIELILGRERTGLAGRSEG